jgi:outer membrane biosynthesis protein TonB
MRVGLTVSIIGHAVILGIGMIAFQMQPLEADDIEALPVELVTVDEATDLLPGIETSKELPQEEPQPIPEIEAEAPAPEPAEAPPEKPEETAEAPPQEPALAPEPLPEPEPAPQSEPVAEPQPVTEPQPEAEPEPAPRVITNPNVPRPRPQPPRDVARTVPPATPEKPEREFNTDDIAALLNKQEPGGGGDPSPATEPQTIGSIDGNAGAAMTQSEIQALKARLYRCWNPPVAVREAGSLVVTVRIQLLADGSLAGTPEVVDTVFDPLMQIAAESAIRAVVQCAPFGDILRPENYAIWSQIDFVFDPREMLGG